MKKVARSATPIMDMYLEKSGEMLQMPVLRRTFGFCVHLDRPCWYIEHSNLNPVVDVGPHLIAASRFLNSDFKHLHDDDLQVDRVSYNRGACALYGASIAGNVEGLPAYEPFLANLNSASCLLDLAEAMLVYIEGLDRLYLRADHIADP